MERAVAGCERQLNEEIGDSSNIERATSQDRPERNQIRTMTNDTETRRTDTSTTIELRLFANFRHTVGEKTIERTYEGNPLKIGAVLTELSTEFPGLEFFEDDGSPREYISILKNGKDIVHIDGMDTMVDEDDRISLFPPVAGG